MQITVNGKRLELAAPQSVAAFAAAGGYDKDRIVVERNGSVLMKQLWDSTVLEPGDRLEIVAFVGGG